MSERDPAIAIAILYERFDNLGAKIDELSRKIDGQSAHRDKAIAELEERVEHIEEQVTRARAFVAGVALGGGILGGVASTLLSHWMSAGG